MKAFLRHVVQRLREGMLREVLTEMKWIYRCSMRYKGAVIWYIFLGVFGTGMGLGSSVVSKYIIDAHKGKLSVKSAEGKGSEFSFTIPVK